MTIELINKTSEGIKLPSGKVLAPDLTPLSMVMSKHGACTHISNGEEVILYNMDLGKSDLPDPIKGVYYIVEPWVALALQERHDLLTVGEIVLDGKGGFFVATFRFLTVQR